MSLKLPLAPPAYDKGDQAQARGAIERADQQNRKRQEDLVLAPSQRLVFYDEHGTEQHFTGAILGGLVRSDLDTQGLNPTEQANARTNIAAGSMTGTPGGSSGQIQFNSGGGFGGFTLGGDATVNTATGALILATVNSNVGSFGDGTHVAAFTVNAKGLTTAASNLAIPTFTSTTVGFVPASGGGTINYLRADGTFAAPPGSGGTGTVTHTSGALTSGQPIIGNGSGDIKVGDLTGDVTTSGGTATTIAANAVTTGKINNAAVIYAKIQNVSANSVLLGAGSSGLGAAPAEISLGTNLSMSGTTLNVSGVIPSAGGLIGVQVITATGSGTYTPTTGTTSIIIQLQGAGAGGGGVQSPTGTFVVLGLGGGSGGWLQKRLTANFSGASYSVGAKGTGGAAGANDGTAGNNTTFTTTGGSPVTYTAGGGGGGSRFGPTNPPLTSSGSSAAGTATGGDINMPGQTGGVAVAASTFNATGSAGGSSHEGTSAIGPTVFGANTSSAGNNGSGKGVGGSGAVAVGTGAAAKGGDGTDGQLVIYEYS